MAERSATFQAGLGPLGSLSTLVSGIGWGPEAKNGRSPLSQGAAWPSVGGPFLTGASSGSLGRFFFVLLLKRREN